MLCKDKLLLERTNAKEQCKNNAAWSLPVILLPDVDTKPSCQGKIEKPWPLQIFVLRKRQTNASVPDCLFQEHRTATFEGDILKLSGGRAQSQQSICGWITALIQYHLRNEWSSWWWWTGELGQVSAQVCSWFRCTWIWVYCHCSPCKGTTTQCDIIVEYRILKTCCQDFEQ